MAWWGSWNTHRYTNCWHDGMVGLEEYTQVQQLLVGWHGGAGGIHTGTITVGKMAWQGWRNTHMYTNCWQDDMVGLVEHTLTVGRMTWWGLWNTH